MYRWMHLAKGTSVIKQEDDAEELQTSPPILHGSSVMKPWMHLASEEDLQTVMRSLHLCGIHGKYYKNGQLNCQALKPHLFSLQIPHCYHHHTEQVHGRHCVLPLTVVFSGKFGYELC